MRIFGFVAAAMMAVGLGAAAPVGASVLGVDQCTTTTPDTKGNSGATFTLMTSMMAECFVGDNDANTIGIDTTVLGMTGWSLNEKIDAIGGATGGDFDFVNNTTANDEAQSGKITADLSAFEYAFIVLKAGNGFGAFKVSVSDTSWDWTSSKGISHASIWTKGESVAAVPLPAGGLLLLGGLGMLALRRKRD